jgi:serine/threonine protein kinase
VLRKTTLREVKILRMLRHPNIVSLTEAFRRKGEGCSVPCVYVDSTVVDSRESVFYLLLYCGAE